MKKIVALVLSLVMVLGLATVAMAADTTNCNTKEVSMKDWAYTDLSTGTTVAFDAADKATVYTFNNITTTTNGVTVTEYGCTVYKVGTLYGVVVAKDFADYQLETADGKFIYVYGISEATFNNTAYTGRTSLVVDKVVKAPLTTPVCGEATADYYVAGKAFYGKGVDTLAYYNGEFILVGAKLNAAPVQGHSFNAAGTKWDMTAGKYTGVTCPVCKQSFKVVDDIAGMAAGTYEVNANGYIVLAATASAPAAGETVESAKTFDAGIAMYVGMSVMAAAGSAVVLKKKD